MKAKILIITSLLSVESWGMDIISAGNTNTVNKSTLENQLDIYKLEEDYDPVLHREIDRNLQDLKTTPTWGLSQCMKGLDRLIRSPRYSKGEIDHAKRVHKMLEDEIWRRRRQAANDVIHHITAPVVYTYDQFYSLLKSFSGYEQLLSQKEAVEHTAPEANTTNVEVINHPDPSVKKDHSTLRHRQTNQKAINI